MMTNQKALTLKRLIQNVWNKSLRSNRMTLNHYKKNHLVLKIIKETYHFEHNLVRKLTKKRIINVLQKARIRIHLGRRVEKIRIVLLLLLLKHGEAKKHLNPLKGWT